MIKRTVYLGNPCKLTISHKQLKIEQDDDNHSVPLEDLGFLIIDHRQIMMTQAVAQELSAENVAVVFCDKRHHPASMLLNLEGHHIQGEIYRQQVAASEPLKKNLWKQTVQAKIKNQATLLQKTGNDPGFLKSLVTRVKSGDAGNMEAQASRAYWKNLFGPSFTRHREGAPPNNLLNYGYAILRASVARAIVGSGMLPGLGIHHHNRYNAFCLADDIMEPYRPFVDDVVWTIKKEQSDFHVLDKETKTRLLNILTMDTAFPRLRRPLMNALSITTVSFVKCFSGEKKYVKYPELI